MLEVRPTGLVVVHVAGGPAVNARVQRWPFTRVVSVSAVTLRGSSTLLNVTVRLNDEVLARPLTGKTTDDAIVTGACIPNRGSGPGSEVVLVPSLAVTVMLPSAPSCCVAAMLPGRVLVHVLAPDGERAIE
jgi:hypothetical protein